ncbi:MAG: N-acetylmuramoyl-L-alanine amidase [Ginsengibacter sp.]
MKKFSLILLCSFLLFFSNSGIAQIKNPNIFPSDQFLLTLSRTHVKTPIKKTTNEKGEVFLQRDMTNYLQTTLRKAPRSTIAQADHGHDHKDEMLLEYLNVPHPSVATLRKYFSDASIEFNVPVEILMATAQVQSNWAQVSESLYGSWGVMGIIENPSVKQISQAAALLNESPESIKRDAKTNIRAAAALLAHYQYGRITTPELTTWFESLKDLTGLTDQEMKHELAIRIFELVNTGSKSVTLWEEIINIKPTKVSIPAPFLQTGRLYGTTGVKNTVDYTLAIPNYTTCNFNARPAGSEHKYYFVHYIGTGTYQGAISWFKDCTSSVSAHYVIRNSDGQVSQVVAENARAWSQGENDANNQGIGVEHEAIVTNLAMWDSEPMLISAGNLASDVCDRNNIPKVRRAQNGDRGIYGHSDVRATQCPNLTQERWDALFSKIAGAKASAAPPFINSVSNPGSGNNVTVTWQANRETKLKGYRLYYANDDQLTSWSLAADENTITSTMTSVTLNPSQFIQVPANDVYHFKLTAVVADGTNPDVESTWGDVYSRSSNTAGKKVLIVDGFYKSAGSYLKSSHNFVTNYFRSIRDNGNFEISSVSNERIHDGTFDLKNYNVVVWFIGDESSAGVIFSTAEKNAIKAFLSNGGKLLFSGSEAAYNLGRSAAAAVDLDFMNNYLKSSYVHDGAVTFTPATGIAGTPFEGLTMPFGITYVEDWPDAIKAMNGAIDILKYNSTSDRNAGIAYKGTFGSGTKEGAVIYLGFTLETARDSTMASFMDRALRYFDVTGTLPVTGLKLETKLNGNNVHIHWSTLTEINTKEFEVEKSTDGIQFFKIATKAAGGNSHQEKQYSIKDALNESGTYYYRIKSIDIDGKITLSNVKNVQYTKEQTALKVGPNPFEKHLTVTNLSDVIRIDLVDLNGRTVLSKEVQNQQTITLETSHLPSGMYHLKSSKSDGSFTSTKMIKM